MSRRIAGLWLWLLLALLVLQDLRVGAAWDAQEEEDEEDEADGFDFFSDDLPEDVEEVEVCADQTCGTKESVGVIESVFTRGLVAQKPSVQSILKEHNRVGTEAEQSKQFFGETLGYVTPWNNRGYDLAKRFRTKFTYISPVWLQIRENPQTKTPILTGQHDIDRQWMRDVQGDKATGPAIVPRVVYERNKLSSSDVPIIGDMLLELVQQEGLDGIVFEIPVSPGTMDMLLQIGQAFLDIHKLFIVVLTRSTTKGDLPITHELFTQLLPVVHRFSMNAYDFLKPGPNAPLPWLENTLLMLTAEERVKMLLGVPFYGYNNNDAVVGSSYLETLQEESAPSTLRWDTRAHECYHTYTGQKDGERHTVYYPCLQFLHERLQMYEEHGVGAAVWEIGQGLDYFFELL